jgi:hypothetical protein
MIGAAIEKVRRLESEMLKMPQVNIETRHVIHGGMYARSITIPAGVVLTGALIKVATLLIVTGHTTVYIGEETRELQGCNVIPASGGRKQVFVAHADTELTVIFPTTARTVEEAEREFTDEYDLLASHQEDNQNHTIITGG